ncbi:hypothetical protein [Glutamicibacter ardleyensis]|uniref:hypothetical protein n=1 Tax=Glutamicibacter ardleyensis TaxID=225894 RepID=UPI003FD3D6EC
MAAMLSEKVSLGLAGEPHQGNLEVCTHLENLWWAKSAQKILDAGLPADAVGLVFLPMWDWGDPLINVGRKGRATGGGQMIFPVRRSYGNESIIVVTSSMNSFKVSHEAVGMGHHVTGEQSITFIPGSQAEVSPRGQYSQVGETMGALRVGRKSQNEIVARLNNVVQSANTNNLWLGMYALISRMSTKIVLRNQEAFTFEINALGKQSAMVLDPIDVDRIVDEMIYGNATEQAEGKPSAAERLITCLLDPTKGIGVDPKKYMADTIQRESFRAVQRALGDPVQGMQIRNFARNAGLSEYAQIAEEFTKSNGKLVTEALVRKAMEIGPSVHANGCAIDDLGDSI